MSTVIRLAEYGRGPGGVLFTRPELDALLSLYADRVASGEWRDYAIIHDSDRAAFCVFRAAHDRPLYTVAKLAGGGRRFPYVVSDAHRILRQSRTLKEALGVFARPFRLV